VSHQGPFGVTETSVEQPMLRLQSFKIRAFTAGGFGSLLAWLSRTSFARTLLWAG
jgi:hypothetical protein